MSVQTPPVTVITLPPDTTTTTAATTTSAGPQPPTTIGAAPTETTVVPAEAPPTPNVPDEQTGGIAALALVIVLLVVLIALVLVWMRRRAEPTVVGPVGPSLTERVRAAVDRAEREEPDDAAHYDIDDVSVADLYPWIEPPDDLTLVVDLRTAEALQGVGVTSLDQLAHMSDDMVRSMIDAGIDVDTRAVEAAARDVINRRGRAR